MRWPGVKLLTALLKNQGVQVQGIILVSPMGEFLLSLLFCAGRIFHRTFSFSLMCFSIPLREPVSAAKFYKSRKKMSKFINIKNKIVVFACVFCRCFQIDGPFGRLERSNPE